MSNLDVSLVQKASGLDPAENRAALGSVKTPDGTGLVVLPEVFARDFGKPGSDISTYAEPVAGPFTEELSALAAREDTTVVAGMFEGSEDPERPYNTLAVVDGNGLRARYRKIHLYDSFGYKESERLLPGDLEPVVVDVAGWKVGLMTCYDLRFPELARELVDRGAEALVLPAAWVAGPRKVDHWRTLLIARAVENTVYVAAAAQPGPRYSGHSLIVSPQGDVLAEAGDDEDTVVSATWDRTVLDEARSENPSLANRRFRSGAGL